MAVFRRFTTSGSARKWCALLVIFGLFAQWAAGLGDSIEADFEARSGDCAMASSQPYCGVTLPAEEQVTVASIFYQPAVLPAAPVATAEKSPPRFIIPTLGRTSIERAILRRPPRT